MIGKGLAAALVGLGLAACGTAPLSGNAGLNIPGQYVTVRVPEGMSIQRAEVIARQRCGFPMGFIQLEEIEGDLRTYRCIETFERNT